MKTMQSRRRGSSKTKKLSGEPRPRNKKKKN